VIHAIAVLDLLLVVIDVRPSWFDNKVQHLLLRIILQTEVGSAKLPTTTPSYQLGDRGVFFAANPQVVSLMHLRVRLADLLKELGLRGKVAREGHIHGDTWARQRYQ
jgi:hypothetical protein